MPLRKAPTIAFAALLALNSCNQFMRNYNPQINNYSDLQYRGHDNSSDPGTTKGIFEDRNFETYSFDFQPYEDPHKLKIGARYDLSILEKGIFPRTREILSESFSENE